jgi:hypothetical protein
LYAEPGLARIRKVLFEVALGNAISVRWRGRALMKKVCALLSGLCVFVAAGRLGAGPQVKEPATQVEFAAKSADGGLSLLGVGVRTKTMFNVKVYAAALYVTDSAVEGPLAVHKGKTTTPAFFKDLTWGDFKKRIVLHFVREVTADQVRGAFKESLTTADKAKVEAFVAAFGDTKVGQEYVLDWAPGGTLEITALGQPKPPIADKAFAAAVFGIWLGEKPIQEELKRALVSRAGEVLR